jgi:hypothetical protein
MAADGIDLIIYGSFFAFVLGVILGAVVGK